MVAFLLGYLAALLSTLVAQRPALRLLWRHFASLRLLWKKAGVRPDDWTRFPRWSDGMVWMDIFTVVLAGFCLGLPGTRLQTEAFLLTVLVMLPFALLAALLDLQLWRLLEKVAFDGPALLSTHATELAIWREEARLHSLPPAARPPSVRRRL